MKALTGEMGLILWWFLVWRDHWEVVKGRVCGLVGGSGSQRTCAMTVSSFHQVVKNSTLHRTLLPPVCFHSSESVIQSKSLMLEILGSSSLYWSLVNVFWGWGSRSLFVIFVFSLEAEDWTQGPLFATRELYLWANSPVPSLKSKPSPIPLPGGQTEL